MFDACIALDRRLEDRRKRVHSYPTAGNRCVSNGYTNYTYGYDKVGNRTSMTLVDDDGATTRDEEWNLSYNDLNQLTYRYVDPWATGTTGEERLSYTYDDNGNLTQVKTETYNGSWSETLRWDYQWNPRDQMKKASKYVNASLDGYVEYEYCLSRDGLL